MKLSAKSTLLACLASVAVLCSCCKDKTVNRRSLRFASVEASISGIEFKNQLDYTEEVNPYTYKSFCNGGGIAIGDLDNDGLQDLVFAGNLVDNQVYKNLGDFTFENLTDSSGLGGVNSWTSGIALADVNGDGWLDVYLSKAGPPTGTNRRNELLINNKDFTFTNVAKQAGVDDYGLSVQAAFFDYDKDGDLDMYLLNNSIRSVGGYDLRPGQREKRDSLGGNKLYRNLLIEEGLLRFVDVSEEAGIYGSDIGFGLGVSIGDINNDEWLDLYVSNDFFERDYLYINQRDGSFEEVLPDVAPELSLGAMGADLADLNGDDYPEIFVTEMRPVLPRRLKSKTVFESWEKSKAAGQAGYHNQYSRNTLLVNKGGEALLDASRIAGVEATDWSWGALAVDLDNDGWKDLFVATGIFKDLLDQDYIHFVANDDNIRSWIKQGEDVISRLVDSMPAEVLPNFAFRNLDGQLNFVDSAQQWGLGEPNLSNGSAYGDLDNDGDLDLVINTFNAPALIYKNRSRELLSAESNYISISLHDSRSVNRFAVGAKAKVFIGDRQISATVMPTRAFMSVSDTRLHFGLGSNTRIDSLVLNWPDGGSEVYEDLEVNTHHLLLRKSTELPKKTLVERPQGSWSELSPKQHQSYSGNDFTAYPLLPRMVSATGPAFATSRRVVGDRHFVFIGGGEDQPSSLYQVSESGEWKEISASIFREHSYFNEVEAVFMDVDGDNDDDLLVAAAPRGASKSLEDVRLQVYENQAGRFVDGSSSFEFPALKGFVCGALLPVDFDADGDLDLFFGTHYVLGRVGIPAPSFVLRNDGTGNFIPIGDAQRGDLDSLHSVTSAVLMNVAGQLAIGVAEEFGPISVLQSEMSGFKRLSRSNSGWWRSLESLDVDHDGTSELFAGNLGLNSVFEASPLEPIRQYVGDFDDNGRHELVLTQYVKGQETTLHQWFDLAQQMPIMRKKFSRFSQYAKASLRETIDLNKPHVIRSIEELQSGMFTLNQNLQLDFIPFPKEAQLSTVEAIAVRANMQGAEVFIAGNDSHFKPEIGAQLSSVGLRLTCDTSLQLSLQAQQYPLLKGEIRNSSWVGDQLIAIRHGEKALFYEN